MPGPWEKYGGTSSPPTEVAGPWTKYGEEPTPAKTSSTGPLNFGDPAELLAKHQANLAAQPYGTGSILQLRGTDPSTGPQTYDPQRGVTNLRPPYLEQVGELMKAPIRLAEGLGHAAKTVYQAVTNGVADQALDLIDPAKQAAGLVDMGLKAMGAYPIGPKEQAGAIGDLAATFAAPKLIKGLAEAPGAVREFIKTRPAKSLIQGKNQFISAIDANEHTAAALDNTHSYLNEYMEKTGRKIKDMPSAASITKDTYTGFVKKYYAPIRDLLAKNPEYARQLARRAELNDTLGRFGYYDKNPLMRSFAETSPQVQAALAEQEVIRGSLNAAVDRMAPVNQGAANMMRTMADLQQVSDMTGIAAKSHAHAQRLAAGRTTSARAMVNKAAEVTSAGIALGMGHPEIVAAVRALKMATAEKVLTNPDILMRKAGRNLSAGRNAAARTGAEQPSGGLSPKPVPIKLSEPTPAKAAVSSGEAEAARQTRMESLRQEGLSPDQIQERMRSEAIPTEGQGFIPFVPDEVGGIPQEVGGFKSTRPSYRTLGEVERDNRLQEAEFQHMVSRGRPNRLSLPPKRSGPIMPSQAHDVIIDAEGNAHPVPIELSDPYGRPTRALIPERVPTEGQSPYQNYGPNPIDMGPASTSQQLPIRTPLSRTDELRQNFGGDIRLNEVPQPPLFKDLPPDVDRLLRQIKGLP